MGFYLRCRRLQSGAAAQADSGGLLMAKISGFAKAFAGRAAHCRNGHQATLANTAEFFNSLLGSRFRVRAFRAPRNDGKGRAMTKDIDELTLLNRDYVASVQ